MMTKTNDFRVLAVMATVLLAACSLMLFAAGKPAEAAFPGTNGKIAFRHQTGAITADIYSINPNGSNPEPLTTTPNAAEYDPAWSANGRKVVFEREHDLFKMRANGSRVTRLTNTPSSEAWESEPTWSPDGSKIAFGRGFEIFVMNADGSGTQQLTTNGDGSYMPAWSPDGTKIAFTRFTTDCGGSFCFQLDIYVMNATAPESVTNQPQQLTDDPASDWGPSWAPLGDRIAFTSTRDGNDNIYAMNADGSDEIPLTKNTASDEEPAYSPTGRKIAFSSDRPGNEEIYIMDSDGTDMRRVTFLARDDDEPDWQPLP